MRGRPFQRMGIQSLALLSGLLIWVLLAGSVSAEMASYTQLAKISADSRVRIARGGEATGENQGKPDLANISEIVLEQMSQTRASIRIQADRSIPSYESFALPDPPRLVVDIPNANHAIQAYPSPAADSLVKKIRSSQYKDAPTKVVRLVFDLISPSSYLVEAKGDQLRIALGEGERPAVAGEPPSQKSPDLGTGAEPGKVTKIDYQSKKNRARILISTEGKVRYDISKISQPPSLVLDIHPAAIMDAAAQPLDVHLLSGQVQKVRAVQSQVDPEKVVRVVADLRGSIKYEVSQDQAGIYLDISPAPSESQAAEAALSPMAAEPPPAEAKKISMDFKDADINNLLRILAEVSGANIVAGSDVKGNVTVRLINIPWDQALDAILKINGYGYMREGNIIRVASLAAIAKETEEQKKREAEERKSRELERREKVALAPLEQYILPVNYVNAEKLMENLLPLASKDPETEKLRGKITIHSETKSIIINDTAEAIEKMKQMASRLDVRTPQVMIEARIVTVREGFAQSLGIQWGGSYTADVRGENDVTVAGTNPPNPAGIFGAPLANWLVNLPMVTAGGIPTAGAFSIGYIGSRLILEARLSLGEAEDYVKNLSSPKVTTMDNKEAEIKSGTQIPFTTVDPSSGRLAISFQEAYLRLKVKPHVTSDKKINMEIEAENNTPGRNYPTGVGDVVSIDKRMAKTEMLAENGSTVVLGGLYVNEERTLEEGIPWLRKLPVIGWLFKRRTVNPVRQELLIFISPTILEEQKI
jgi:type IV pilus assembly protein PilQ